MARVEILLQFDRQCEEAIAVYQKAFDAELKALHRFADANPSDWQCENDEDKNLIYHAQIMIGESRILMCDNLFTDLPRGHSVHPVIIFKRADELRKAYEVLADGANVINAPKSTTYSECVATLVDKFGIYWDLMV